MAADAREGLEFLDLPPGTDAALAALAGPVRGWFQAAFGTPTAAQRLAWPALAAGKHLLLCAPTGGGKTLAAFLPLLGPLLTAPPVAGIRGLYVAPYKALVSDVRRNLRLALRGLRPFLPTGSVPPRLGLRTGDTPAAARRDLRLRPPDVLLTTPESLAVLLSQTAFAELFADLRFVIIDEVHALAPSKRGADLALSLERLDELAACRPQRVGLSATCAPPAEAARCLAGVGRACAVAQAAESAPLQVQVELLEQGPAFLGQLVDRLGPELTSNRSTLVFTNARGLAERLAWALRRRHPAWDEEIAVHHSSLAAQRRRTVERLFKRGRLRAVVSSTSLELGIDVGPVEGVVLVHPPGGVVRLLQRVGRAGHGPGRVRRGLVLAATPAELLEAVATTAACHSAQYEPLRVPEHPLDVLCQQLAGMAAAGAWTADAAFALVRRAFPYRELPRADFDDCLAYLSGRRRDGREWLPARLRRQGDTFTLHDARTARLLRRNLGTIVGEEACRVVTEAESDLANGRLVGEVEDGFADRLVPGDRFLLDGRCLEYRRRSGGDVIVQEVFGRPQTPRWAGEGLPLSPELARRLYLLRGRLAETLRDGRDALLRLLRDDCELGEHAALALASHVEHQEAVSEVPGVDCLIEAVPREIGTEYSLHTPLSRAGNDALARVISQRLARDHGKSALSLVADLGALLVVRGAGTLSADDWRALLAPAGFDADLGEALAGGPTLRERFRRVALTGLMLLRNPLGGRRRVGGSDWAERRLFDLVADAEPEFVLLRQAEREAREEHCDAVSARAYLEQLTRLPIRCRPLAQTSPFAAGWTTATVPAVEPVETPVKALRQLHVMLTSTGERGV